MMEKISIKQFIKIFYQLSISLFPTKSFFQSFVKTANAERFCMIPHKIERNWEEMKMTWHGCCKQDVNKGINLVIVY